MRLLKKQHLFLLLGITALALFLSGVLLGNLAHLAACPLCILQRMLYLLLGTVGLLIGVGARNPTTQRAGAWLMMLIALVGMYVAGYQSYIQHHPDAGGCTVNSPWWEEMVYWAGEKLPLLFMSSGLCTDPGVKLLGLSLAEYSLLTFTGIALLCVLFGLRNER
ncbi:disulfide bond formation protein B [Denitratisoma oestradiolicum]|uniref:Disulfide bond formation protein B n=1 Tax=Denitratisoma oestradiolicum TaxID=311182 RepID=A0A6S6XYI8_9PROT|nr:disulfide bond formation protein B [Denitratisoma oestradiolicum]TWO80070.1 hypothetical protein CBW56_10875 [Denitratisoma oestradiolicum]CAB1370098.1 Disulfide bond formation protein B [Denitratisoma oestradiolicum]